MLNIAACQLLPQNIYCYHKKHLKKIGPIRHCELPHAHSPGVASSTVMRRLRIDVHDNNDNAWQRGPLWPHEMGPINCSDRWSWVHRQVRQYSPFLNYFISITQKALLQTLQILLTYHCAQHYKYKIINYLCHAKYDSSFATFTQTQSYR